MVYDPTKDFVGLWRNNGASVSKLEMPGLDFVISALARAGVINLTVSATAPVANQTTTAWLKAAVPSYSAEGALYLWDKITTAYLAATPALFLQFLEACANESGISWWTTTGGAPLNTVGNNGDYAIRTDGIGGIYGPKVAGAWPADPLPGTTNELTSTELDNTFGATEGNMIYRGAALWQALAIGADYSIMIALASVPEWTTLSGLMDVVFGDVRGSLLYRDAGAWKALAPGASNYVLTTNGAGANPGWTPKSSEFASGTVMLFQQTSAPVGWTKQVAVTDCGLRVTSGAVGTTPGSAFSTVFAQTAVGDTTLSTAQMPAHTHPMPGNAAITNTTAVAAGGHAFADVGTSATGSTGGGTAHAHSINLTLAYIDVIIATKN